MVWARKKVNKSRNLYKYSRLKFINNLGYGPEGTPVKITDEKKQGGGTYTWSENTKKRTEH